MQAQLWCKRTINQSRTLDVFGFMQLSLPTKLVYCLDLLGDQVHKNRYIESKSNACD
jgi:hypothetical protein